MKTDAVMCMAFTSTRPSLTPLLRTAASTFGVMFSKPMRAGMLKVRYSVCDFIWPENTPRIRSLVSARSSCATARRSSSSARTSRERASGRCRAGFSSSANRCRTRSAGRSRKKPSLDIAVGPVIETFDRVHRDDRREDPLSLRDRRLRVLAGRRRGRVRDRMPRRSRGSGRRRSMIYEVNAHAKAVIERGLAFVETLRPQDLETSSIISVHDAFPRRRVAVC